ncbi:biopolymer transport protein ExbD/TolR [Raphidiopsis curvata NIES-932]|nr:biopolymer transport protein ExbD/TolR [Raphidiopsis curvata NIES-932]
MKVNLHTPIEEVEIQIIPLIDVVFCILTFFLLAALQFTRQQAINVDLPKATTGTTSAASSQPSNILPVTIDAVGKTYIERDPVTREQLEVRLKQYITGNPQGILVLNASPTATYNDVVQTLDLLRQVGGNRVSLGIIPGASQPNFPGTPIVPPLNLPTVPGADPGLNLPSTLPTPPTAPQR